RGEVDSCQEIDCPLVVAGGDGAELLELGEEILDEVTRFVKLLVMRFCLRLALGGMTVLLPAFSSGAMTRSSASKPLSAITMSAAICGSRMSAPSRSQACPGVSVKPVGLATASTVALILVLNPPLLRPIASSWPTFFGLRLSADGRARWSNRSSRIRCRHRRPDA